MLNLSSVTPRVCHSAGATNQAGGREETNSKPPRVGVEIYELTLSGATHRTEFFLPIRRNLNHRHEWAGQCVLCYPEPLQCKKKAFCLRVTDGGTFPFLEELRPCGRSVANWPDWMELRKTHLHTDNTVSTPTTLHCPLYYRQGYQSFVKLCPRSMQVIVKIWKKTSKEKKYFLLLHFKIFFWCVYIQHLTDTSGDGDKLRTMQKQWRLTALLKGFP